jgi:hypothetical protein
MGLSILTTSIGKFIWATMMMFELGIIIAFTRGFLTEYLLIPAILIWVNALGGYLQDNSIGSEWVQGHLHNLGVVTYLCSLILGYLLLWAIFKPPHKRATFITYKILKWTTPVHGLVTLLCVSSKVSQVTIWRDEYIAKGYSGELDVGDIAALIAGFATMVLNHLIMRPRVLRKKEALLMQ